MEVSYRLLLGLARRKRKIRTGSVLVTKVAILIYFFFLPEYLLLVEQNLLHFSIFNDINVLDCIMNHFYPLE